MEGTLSIRAARAADAAGIAALAGELGYPNDARELAARLGEYTARPDAAVLVADTGGGVAAWVALTIVRNFYSPAFVEIAGLVVQEGRRRQGIGGLLLEASVAWARDREVHRIRVRCNSERAEALAFYECRGFRLSKRQQVLELPVGE